MRTACRPMFWIFAGLYTEFFFVLSCLVHYVLSIMAACAGTFREDAPIPLHTSCSLWQANLHRCPRTRVVAARFKKVDPSAVSCRRKKLGWRQQRKVRFPIANDAYHCRLASIGGGADVFTLVWAISAAVVVLFWETGISFKFDNVENDIHTFWESSTTLEFPTMTVFVSASSTLIVLDVHPSSWA